MSIYLHLDEKASKQIQDSYHSILNLLLNKAQAQQESDLQLKTKASLLTNIFQSQSFYLNSVGNCSDQVVIIDQEQCAYLQDLFKKATKFVNKFGYQEYLQNPLHEQVQINDKLIVFTQEGAGLSLALESNLKPFIIDFTNISFRKRLLSGGRQKEPVARAVLSGIDSKLQNPVIFDATAGLGTESMVLAHAGAKVLSFERNIATWIILSDALNRAKGSKYFPFTLPTLYPIGTIDDYQKSVVEDFDLDQPLVVYYDPMFPESDDSARVKKGMYLLQQINNSPDDVKTYLNNAFKLTQTRVVLKRPKDSPLIEIEGNYSYVQIESGPCRYDCYLKEH